MQPELLKVADKTTQYLKSSPLVAHLTGGNGDMGSMKDHPLLNLIELVYKQMKMIAESHELTLKNYQSILKRYKLVEVETYTVIDYWGQAQVVLQQILTDYLNIQSVSADEQLKSSFPEQIVNISSFFSRRKPQT